MAESKVLAWGVLCGSGERAGKIHEDYGGGQALYHDDDEPDSTQVLWLDCRSSCGPHRSVALLDSTTRATSAESCECGHHWDFHAADSTGCWWKSGDCCCKRTRALESIVPLGVVERADV